MFPDPWSCRPLRMGFLAPSSTASAHQCVFEVRVPVDRDHSFRSPDHAGDVGAVRLPLTICSPRLCRSLTEEQGMGMPGERLSMRKIGEILRLRWESDLPGHRKLLAAGQASVSDYLSRARRAGLTWPLPDVSSDQRPVPDWSTVHRDLRRPNVTLALLWEEYRAATTDGFCARRAVSTAACSRPSPPVAGSATATTC
jgi:hypothetical protein